MPTLGTKQFLGFETPLQLQVGWNDCVMGVRGRGRVLSARGEGEYPGYLARRVQGLVFRF